MHGSDPRWIGARRILLAILFAFAIAFGLGFASMGHAENRSDLENTEPDPVEIAEPGDATSPQRPPPPVPIGVRLAEPLEDEQFRLAYSFERRHFHEIYVGGRDRQLAH